VTEISDRVQTALGNAYRIERELGADVGKVLWMLDRGGVNQRLDNREKAIDSYARVVGAWRNPAELKPYADEARRGLEALRSDPSRR
jgi:hypothetical protein